MMLSDCADKPGTPVLDLNGDVLSVGDKVAVATTVQKEGKLRVGTVVGFREHNGNWFAVVKTTVPSTVLRRNRQTVKVGEYATSEARELQGLSVVW